METNKNVLLINDFPGYGKVALAAMTPILSRKGYNVFQLPTAVISNTLDYGRFRIQDMTDYMQDTFKVWEELQFVPDCICTGFVTTEYQADVIREYIRKRKGSDNSNCLVIVDPIMADGGKLYNGIGEERVKAMRKLAACADVMVPNMTEAFFLTGTWLDQEKANLTEVKELTDALRKISGKSVVITSAVMTAFEGKENHFVYGYDHINQEYFQIFYEHLPIQIAGSGDIFSAIMTGELLAGEPLKAAVTKAVKILSALIIHNQKCPQQYKGIMIEKYWELFEQ